MRFFQSCWGGLLSIPLVAAHPVNAAVYDALALADGDISLPHSFAKVAILRKATAHARRSICLKWLQPAIFRISAPRAKRIDQILA